MLEARLEIGIVWIQIRPGPVTFVLNKPSPPRRTFFAPLIISISIVTVESIIARYPVSMYIT